MRTEADDGYLEREKFGNQVRRAKAYELSSLLAFKSTSFAAEFNLRFGLFWNSLRWFHPFEWCHLSREKEDISRSAVCMQWVTVGLHFVTAQWRVLQLLPLCKATFTPGTVEYPGVPMYGKYCIFVTICLPRASVSLYSPYLLAVIICRTRLYTCIRIVYTPSCVITKILRIVRIVFNLDEFLTSSHSWDSPTVCGFSFTRVDWNCFQELLSVL